MRTPYAAFEHPAAPDRDILNPAKIVYLLCLAESPHPAQFDVDNLAGSQIDRLPCVLSAGDRLIQADRRREFLLEPGMVGGLKNQRESPLRKTEQLRLPLNFLDHDHDA